MNTHKKPKAACSGGDFGGATKRRRDAVMASVPTILPKDWNLSNLIDQATERAERCTAIAAHYSAMAEKHSRIKAELERLIPLDETVILEGAGAFADYAEALAEEVWGND